MSEWLVVCPMTASAGNRWYSTNARGTRRYMALLERPPTEGEAGFGMRRGSCTTKLVPCIILRQWLL